MRPLPTITGALIAVTLVTVATGCGLRSEPTGAIPPAPVSVIDSANQTVAVQHQPQRIVSLDPGSTELLFDVGAGSKVVGRSGGQALPAAAQKVKVVSADRPRAIRALHPDLVIAPAADAAALRSVGAPVYAVDGATIAGAERDMANVGLLAGYGPQARVIAGRTTTAIEHITAQMSAHPPQKTFLDQGYGAYPPPQLAAELIAAAGGNPVAVNTDAALRKAAPQVYLIQQGSQVTPKQVEHDPATRSLPAVKAGRVHTIPGWWVATDGPSMSEAVKHLAQLIHPGAGAGQ